MKNVTLMQNLMRELQESIEQYKEPMESHTATVQELLVDMRRKRKMVERIEALLKQVPSSHRNKDKMVTRFLGMRKKANHIMKHLMDWIKI